MEIESTQRFLTKSRFKLALECPTKLFYVKKRNIQIENWIMRF